MSQAYLSNVELGRVQMPNVEIRRRLADVLRMSHVEILIAGGDLDPAELPRGTIHAVTGSYQQKLDALPTAIRRTLEKVIDLAVEAHQSRGR